MELNYQFPNRDIVNSKEWQVLCQRAQVCSCYGTAEGGQEEPGFENEIFVIRPYDWSEPDELLPNFEHKPSGFKLWWYKYAFRSTDMNQPLSEQEIKALFETCAETIPFTIEEDKKLIEMREELVGEIGDLLFELNLMLNQANRLGLTIQLSGSKECLLKELKGKMSDKDVFELQLIES